MMTPRGIYHTIDFTSAGGGIQNDARNSDSGYVTFSDVLASVGGHQPPQPAALGFENDATGVAVLLNWQTTGTAESGSTSVLSSPAYQLTAVAGFADELGWPPPCCGMSRGTCSTFAGALSCGGSRHCSANT